MPMPSNSVCADFRPEAFDYGGRENNGRIEIIKVFSGTADANRHVPSVTGPLFIGKESRENTNNLNIKTMSVVQSKTYETPFLNAELVSTECGFAASEVKTLGAAIDDAPESDYGTF
mgnify:CR=1 FL=1